MVGGVVAITAVNPLTIAARLRWQRLGLERCSFIWIYDPDQATE